MGSPLPNMSTAVSRLGLPEMSVALLVWFVVLCAGAGPLGTDRTAVLATAAILAGVQTGLGVSTGVNVTWTGGLHDTSRRRLIRSGVITTVSALAIASAIPSLVPSIVNAPDRALVGGVLATGSLALCRWVRFRLHRQGCRRGRIRDRILIVADHPDAHALLDLIESHDETGWRAVGWVDGDDEESLLTSARRVGATSVLMAPGTLRRPTVQAQVHQLRDHGIRVHVDLGLRMFLSRHLRLGSVGYEPLLLLEPPRFEVIQRTVKRVVDVIAACLLLVVSLPILAFAAAAIVISDRGPVLFRQRRIGRHGVPFDLVKLRTMVPDAEQRFDEVAHLNERRNGPLFTSRIDPRVTRVGRVLRATSIDELPQLWSVIRGDMSLVGPRPALPEEVSQFDDRLMARHRMRPGITGIWQVHHRDDPSFDTYRTADLVYVEHWSLLLDLSILLRTLPAVVGRSVHSLRTRAVPTPEPVLP